jgi:hypothetical protein
MTLIRRRTHILAFWVPAILAAVSGIPPGARLASAAEPTVLVPPGTVPSRALTDAELGKINRMIADKGKEIRLNNEITAQLGVTRGGEFLLSRGIAVKDEAGDIHQFEPLPDDRGYLLLKLNPQINTIYWVSKAFVPTAARSRVPGQDSEELPAAEAQTGAGKELAFWAAFARD